ncbi:uncharacterized protein LOC117326266 [Pecten maximus]|uniref:uncharacterized protein LOC117326266 n=1 Tax=Pecten maximus TaxID=6579 RepID=UPI0014591140|nr:uncharacterized protein LOC117326266 [Pecten maximus]
MRFQLFGKLHVNTVPMTRFCRCGIWEDIGSFQASHNVFLSAHGVYLLVFRLTDFLRDKLETDRLKRWIRLIGTFSKDELTAPNLRSKRIQAPPIIFVGTFLDELKKEYNDYNKQIADINRSITKFPELSSLHFVRFCTVDNSLGNDHRELDILRGFITEAAEHQDQWERELPTTWLKLELELYQAREKGTKILTLDEVIEMNKRSLAPLKDEDEIKLALEYLHSIRSVIYFREFNYVINDPQWLADFFSILITDDNFLPSYDLLFNLDLDLYKTKGELTQKLITRLLCLKKNEAFAPFKPILLALMEKFGLIVRILLSENDTENAQFSETYTIPSKLSELQNIDRITDEVNALKHINLAVSKTLCFVFDDVYVPYELFPRIFAKVLRTYRATSVSPQSSEEAAGGSESTTETTRCLYKDFGCFEVNDICRMILSMHAERSTIAVTIFSPTESKLLADSGRSIRLSIDRIIQETLQMSSQQHFHYSHQMHCNFHLSPYDTPVQLFGIINSENGVPCKGGECQRRHRLSDMDTKFWDVPEHSSKFQEKNQIEDEKMSENVSSDNVTKENAAEFTRRPTPQELSRLSRLIDASSCELLFCGLGLSYPEIHTTLLESSWMAGTTLVTNLFLKWTKAYPNQTFNHIKQAMTLVGMATDRILEAVEPAEELISEDIVPHDVLGRPPSGDEIKKIATFIGNTFFNLFLELGLSPQVIEQHMLCQSSSFQQKMKDLLQCWKDDFKCQATIGRLLYAMKLCQIDWDRASEIFALC